MKLLSISTMGHLQVLLLLTMSQELQGEATNHSGSVLFLRVGVALRMAQDLVSLARRGVVLCCCCSTLRVSVVGADGFF